MVSKIMSALYCYLFLITKNKIQSQTLGVVAVMLNLLVFAHGQLYVALSCVTIPDSWYVIKSGRGKGLMNVIHKNIIV
ncbi:uncharacterized protein VP01_1910g7 [Puccinia sorghi]|uniref:Uncharacterized protein n=1 Tax=Puccinia sorghi TaxID=27349 RepID=A0A0L6VDA6_9BASI|nr:uncharacterized protein VP01_1910g7 [Puccinia sorghi]